MTVRILHCHSSFDLGGKEARAVQLMNAFGRAARHVVVSGVPGALGARQSIAAGIDARFPERHPPLTGPPSLARLKALAAFMADFDLVLSYNWGAIDAVMARRLFARYLPPLVHHEDGFNADEAERLKPERNLYRRIALGAAHALVVPSQRLETIARRAWGQPARRVRRIANGIAVAAYAGAPRLTIPGLSRHPGDIIVGTLAGLRPVKNLPRLVRAGAAIPQVRLVIVGEGPERGTISAEASRLGVEGRVLLPGFIADSSRYLGHFDLFALSSDSEQFPIAVIEAMAAALPIAATDVGDVRAMVASENLPFVVKDEAGLGAAIATLASDAGLRARIGAANRARAAAHFDQAAMLAAYRKLYEDALMHPGALSES